MTAPVIRFVFRNDDEYVGALKIDEGLNNNNLNTGIWKTFWCSPHHFIDDKMNKDEDDCYGSVTQRANNMIMRIVAILYPQLCCLIQTPSTANSKKTKTSDTNFNNPTTHDQQAMPGASEPKDGLTARTYFVDPTPKREALDSSFALIRAYQLCLAISSGRLMREFLMFLLLINDLYYEVYVPMQCIVYDGSENNHRIDRDFYDPVSKIEMSSETFMPELDFTIHDQNYGLEFPEEGCNHTRPSCPIKNGVRYTTDLNLRMPDILIEFDNRQGRS
ncbi:hypothetical protein T265_06952 [Opisthorchis viverrini]|uniref:Uncharacterized protein n=1 Tax=Opisthorchis viverrini TaxID=6198 RepID=A0A074ZES1_OPIVI|nr:hypothetical protein T265_06952 [Opisthorchis viverrini]KER25663.1 hypothetical protein T265_06952 [Opisthorchis viverrini]